MAAGLWPASGSSWPGGAWPRGRRLQLLRGDKVCYDGDSLTAQSQWQSVMLSIIGSKLGTVTNTAVNGSKISDCLAAPRVAAVIATGANVVFQNAVINDIAGSTNLATFAANYAQWIADIKAGLPNARIGCLNAFAFGEKFPEPFEGTRVKPYNDIVRSVCLAAGVVMFDIHAAQQSYEAQNNIPAPGVDDGVLTLPADGIHPNSPRGVPFISNTVLAQCDLGW